HARRPAAVAGAVRDDADGVGAGRREAHPDDAMSRRGIVLVAAVALISVIAAAQVRLESAQVRLKPDATTVDVHAARDEAVRILQDLIRIDTSNPPGNETKAAEYLKALLEREQIPGEIVALEASRGNLIARLKSSGRKPPLLS